MQCVLIEFNLMGSRDRDVSRRREDGQSPGRRGRPLAGKLFERPPHLLRPGHSLFNADAHLQHALVTIN